MAAPCRPRAAPTWREIYIYMYLLYKYKVFFVLPYMGRVIPIETVGYYIPDSFIELSPCGTKILSYLPCRRRGATRGVGSSRRVDRTRRSHATRTTERSSSTCTISGIIRARFARRGSITRGDHVVRGPPDHDQHTC